MQMTTVPKLSRDLQRHLGRQLGDVVGRTLEEPLTREMEALLDRLGGEEQGPARSGEGLARRARSGRA